MYSVQANCVICSHTWRALHFIVFDNSLQFICSNSFLCVFVEEICVLVFFCSSYYAYVSSSNCRLDLSMCLANLKSPYSLVHPYQELSTVCSTSKFQCNLIASTQIYLMEIYGGITKSQDQNRLKNYLWVVYDLSAVLKEMTKMYKSALSLEKWQI